MTIFTVREGEKDKRPDDGGSREEREEDRVKRALFSFPSIAYYISYIYVFFGGYAGVVIEGHF